MCDNTGPEGNKWNNKYLHSQWNAYTSPFVSFKSFDLEASSQSWGGTMHSCCTDVSLAKLNKHLECKTFRNPAHHIIFSQLIDFPLWVFIFSAFSLSPFSAGSWSQEQMGGWAIGECFASLDVYIHIPSFTKCALFYTIPYSQWCEIEAVLKCICLQRSHNTIYITSEFECTKSHSGLLQLSGATLSATAQA